MNTRIKELRKYLKLTQKEFGQKVGLKPSTINDIEHFRCKVNDRLQIAICAKFSVNEEWLKYGIGDMFVNENKKFNEFFEIYKTLTTPLQDFLIQVAKDLLDTQKKL